MEITELIKFLKGVDLMAMMGKTLSTTAEGAAQLDKLYETIEETAEFGFVQCGKHEHAYDTAVLYLVLYMDKLAQPGLEDILIPNYSAIMTAFKTGLGFGIRLGNAQGMGQTILEQAKELPKPPSSEAIG